MNKVALLFAFLFGIAFLNIAKAQFGFGDYGPNVYSGIRLRRRRVMRVLPRMAGSNNRPIQSKEVLSQAQTQSRAR